MHKHDFANEKLTRRLGPVGPSNQVQVKDALGQAEQVEEEVGADVRIAETLVEEARVHVEVLDASVRAFAVLQVHVLLRQADQTDFFERCQLIDSARRIHLLTDLCHNVASVG